MLGAISSVELMIAATVQGIRIHVDLKIVSGFNYL